MAYIDKVSSWQGGMAAAMGLGDIPGDDAPIQLASDSDRLSDELGSQDVSAMMARSSGQPLDSGLSEKFSASMGMDFSNVRVHTDAAADGAATLAGARAMTTGSDVYFKQGEYAPGTQRGQHLIAHEVAHVKQQSEGRTAGLSRKADTDDSSARAGLENEADQMADKAVKGEPASDDSSVPAESDIDLGQVDPGQLSLAAQEQGVELAVHKDQETGKNARLGAALDRRQISQCGQGQGARLGRGKPGAERSARGLQREALGRQGGARMAGIGPGSRL